MPATEPNTPPPRGALSRLRRNKGLANASANSFGAGSTDGDESEPGGGLRASMDAAIGKVKERTKRRSVDDRRGSDDTSTKRLSALLPRKRRGSKQDVSGPERNLSAVSTNDSLAGSGNHSESSLVDDSGHSSLLTDDNSDVEGKPIRPTLSPHQSHAGLLTLSSPEFQAQSQSVASANELESSPGTIATHDPLSNIPHIVEPSNTDPVPATAIANRSASPAERLKGAFALPRRQVDGADTDSVKSAGSGGGGLGALFRPKSRRSSVSSQAAEEPAKDAVSAPQSDTPVPGAEGSRPQPNQSEEQPATPKQRKRGRVNTESLPATPPNLVDTPTTLVTPPTPTLPNDDVGTFPRKPVTTAPGASPPSSRPLNSIESIRHRRAQSNNLPSKLSNSIPAPLTPTVEESKTPGGTLTQPNSASGFFTSFFSATQKAADQLSNNLNTAIGVQSKGKPGATQTVDGQDEEVVSSKPETATGEDRQRTVDTLGKGELSLSHLGISETVDPSPMTSTVDLPQQASSAQNGQTSQKAEEAAAARAVSVAYEKPVQNLVSQATGRPMSVASQDHLTTVGDQSPPRSGADTEGMKRSGSVRSKFSGRARRHRASSATVGTVATGSTIAAAIQASNAALANPSINGSGHRLTGFAVASSKRNKDFHQLFRSVPEDDYLIEDYSAALQRDILLHGRLYVSEGHICFSSNILGWVTNLVISFDEVVSVEKKSTAVIFPNAIVIQTLQARNTFASLVARDSTYDLLIGIWKISHPNLKSSLNGVTLDDSGTGDKTEVADPDGSDDESGDGSDDEVYDEDDDDDDVGSFTDAGVAPSVAGSEIGDVTLSRKTSAAPVGTLPQTIGAAKGPEGADAVVAGAAVGADFPGPQTHAPTECADAIEHYDRPLTDTTIPAPLGKVYSLMFGPSSNAFMRKWLVEDQKSRELNLAEDKFGLDNEHKTMTFDYIKPLNAPVGPRQTKCITTNTLTAFDLEKAVSIDCSTQTPDVPSGSVFTTKTKYCLMWGPDNSTRLIASCTIEWTGKSWLKGPIEKGANDGQIEYVKAIILALKAAVTTKPAVKSGVAKKGKRKGKKEISDAEVTSAATPVIAEPKPVSWGPLEPLHQILDIVGSMLRPFITSQVVIAVLFALLLYSWITGGPRARSGVGMPGFNSPQRLAAYEEMWRRDESELWDWLEDRVGLDHLYAPSLRKDQRDRQRTVGMAKKLDGERMSERQMDDAIRVTEERLGALKEAVAKKKGAKGEK